MTPKFISIILVIFCPAIFADLNAQSPLECTVQEDFIFRGCLEGKDCIPALTNPSLLTATQATYLEDSDLVLGVYRNGVARAYPHPIMWWHEIVNDTLGGEMFTISFCPLTSTGLLFDATLRFQERTFGVSGLLYNNNLIMYDRVSGETLFPQLCYRGIDGGLEGRELQLLPIVETTWGAWKGLYPNTTVLSDETGFSRDYTTYPYGDYRTNNDFLIHSLTNDDPRLERKDIVFGLNLNGNQRAYPFGDMGEQAVLNDELGGTKVLIIFSKEAKLAVGYVRNVDGQDLKFRLHEVLPDGLIHIEDTLTGTIWNIQGEAISGPLADEGAKLQQIPAYNSMWFAWSAFWENTQIANIDSIITSVEEPGIDEFIGPEEFVLFQNYPNPFNPETNITYDLNETSLVTLKIYDLSGREVRTLLQNESQSPGRNVVSWEGRNNLGEWVASGVYIYRIKAGSFVASRKMILLK